MIRKAEARWIGGFKDGKGSLSLESGTFKGAYSFSSRFENGEGTNPEELIGAANSGCFSMAFAMLLEQHGFKPQEINTVAEVSLEKEKEGYLIEEINLVVKAKIPEIDTGKFLELAREAKSNCPVSLALAGTQITLDATLV